MAEENIEITREKFSSTLTNKRKHAVWENICGNVNALGVAKRSLTDVREKWRAMRNAGRGEMTRENNSLGKTGGGKQLAPPKATGQRTIELFRDEPSFLGIEGGIESGECCARITRSKILNMAINSLL